MKNIQPKILCKYLKFVAGVALVTNVYARSPAVLPVRGLEIPDANKKYLNGPADLNKTAYRFDRGTPKILIAMSPQLPQLVGTNQRTTTLIIALAGAFALISPLIYFAFFRKKAKSIIVPQTQDTNNYDFGNVTQMTRQPNSEEKSNIRKVS